MTNALKPCPYCGGEAKIVRDYERDSHCSIPIYFIKCSSCGSNSAPYKTERRLLGDVQTMEELIYRWNRRAN
jgi:Lar family restriction alleviation protein